MVDLTKQFLSTEHLLSPQEYISPGPSGKTVTLASAEILIFLDLFASIFPMIVETINEQNFEVVIINNRV